jgi:hypothetical protein
VLVILLALLLASVPPDSQLLRDKGNESGLIVYDVWAVASLATGAVGYATTQDQKWQGVHIANLVWGGVNAGIGLISSIIAFRDPHTPEDEATMRKHGFEQQRLYAINAIFDVATTMVSVAIYQGVKDDRWQGFAVGSLVQSLFLLGFDTTMSMYHWLNNRRSSPDSAFNPRD